MFDSYAQCAQTLCDVEAIDYFFAKELVSRLGQGAVASDLFIFIALSQAHRQGNSCLVMSDIADKCYFKDQDQGKTGWQFSDLETLTTRIQAMLTSTGLDGLVFFDNGQLYTARYWHFEQEIVAAISQRLKPLPMTESQIDVLRGVWPYLFSCEHTQVQDWQQVATALSVNRPLAMLSGGPGTGKTYTIARLLMALQVVWEGKLSIALTAPTGKAAQRLTESIQGALLQFSTIPTLSQYAANIQQSAVTLHRLIGVSRRGVRCKHHRDNPLEHDVVIVDESSMIDLAMMTRLFRALSPRTRVILVGDPQQLPSVEAGNVLGDIIQALHTIELPQVDEGACRQFTQLCPHLPNLSESEIRAPSIHFSLHATKRFSGSLALAAIAINKGQIEDLWCALTKVEPGLAHQVSGVGYLGEADINATLTQVAGLWFGEIQRAPTIAQALKILTSRRWLTPFRQGDWGSDSLNQQLDSLLGNASDNKKYYAGRPIMIVENNYSQRLFNGDVGIIWPAENGKLMAWFETSDKQFRSIPLSRLPQHQTVYAMSIHKSQGSEFEQVLLFAPEAPSAQARTIYTRELIYTGLTRAKHGCVLVTDKHRLGEAITSKQRRKTGLPNRLQRKITRFNTNPIK